MKKPIFTTAIMALTLLTACNDSAEIPTVVEELSRLQTISTTIPDTSVVVSETKAIQIALKQLSTHSSRAADREIKSVETLIDSLGIAQMYVVNFTDSQGFVIISATKDYLPIIAESDHGNFDLSNISSDHPVNIWLKEQKFKINHTDLFDPEVKASIASLWTALDMDRKEIISDSRSGVPGKPQVYYDSLARWSTDPNLTVYLYEDYMRTTEYTQLPETTKGAIQAGLIQWGNSNYGSIESSTIVLRRNVNDYVNKQLIHTKWGPEAPFNTYHPNKYPLGCSTIAAGQIINYHKHPASIDWNSIENTGYSTGTQKFLYQLAVNIGVKFGTDQSSASISSIKNCLSNYYNYKVTKQAYNGSKVRSEVLQGFPVLMSGYDTSYLGIYLTDGHAWVCDGVKYGNYGFEIRVLTIDYRPDASIVPNLMVEAYKQYVQTSYSPLRFHYNWGWYGDCDGFFDDSDITVITSSGNKYDFEHNKETLYIRPQ